ncbi:carbon-nitrogen hydrolase family protein [Pseudomonas indica]|uniref:carbon-nitrogen hydrolase family protein n=1 Tax=Pseudomonas indica TaxID=137658 RepID=UPI000BABC1C7|nr:carbon-nitrogen hydrolase family protein [Pseudomonas indica]PAU52486.1 hypothetical protein BZL42_24170 [Pseudomonas indica]
MKLCAAQLASVSGDLRQNLDKHCRFVEHAARLGAELIVFPELSLTRYETARARELALPWDSPLLDELQHLSDAHRIIIGAGLPTPTPEGTRISMLIVQPHKPREVYSKQLLPDDEFPFFVPDDHQVVIRAGDTALAPAICYESLQPDHAEQAARLGANVYLASVAKSANGVAKVRAHYPEVAKRHGMTVLLANGVGPVDGFVTAGQSAVWNNRGERLGQLGEEEEGLLLVDTLSEALSIHSPLR